jgi:hypothetical protein
MVGAALAAPVVIDVIDVIDVVNDDDDPGCSPL